MRIPVPEQQESWRPLLQRVDQAEAPESRPAAKQRLMVRYWQVADFACCIHRQAVGLPAREGVWMGKHVWFSYGIHDAIFDGVTEKNGTGV